VGGLCNICGGAEFEPGPGGRMTPEGSLPRCSTCESLERHRGLRRALEQVPRPMLAARRALQISPDPSLDRGWFRDYELSEYGAENSIDLEKPIDRPASSYDFISLSLVIEFVREDRKAFDELLRIGSDELIVHLTFTSGLRETDSRHGEEPTGEYGTYHDYGWDFDQWFGTKERGLSILVIDMPDPVTGDTSHPFCFLFRRRSDAEAFHAVFATDPDATVRSYTLLPD
jgi:hypothetical protein